MAHPRHSPAYMSPHSSPSLSFGSPSMNQSNGWPAIRHTRTSPLPSRSMLPNSPSLTERPLNEVHLRPSNSLPSPPQHDHHYPTSSEYSTGPVHGPPLSPPCSTDGLMSPHSGAHDYSKEIHMDPNLPSIWMNTYTSRDPNLPLPLPGHGDAPSPLPLSIEDILREQEPQQSSGMSGGYLDENGFAEPQMSRAVVKRTRTTWDCAQEPKPENYTFTSGYDHLGPAADASPKQREPRKKRHLTEPSEANYHCNKCGKFFSRIWNYNAHLETHDPKRARPHACTADGCEKAFVRRTDLTRHQQCVSCSPLIFYIFERDAEVISRYTQRTRSFAASSATTCLRGKTHCEGTALPPGHLKHQLLTWIHRHEDDGCPKRVDIVSRASKNKPITWNSQTLSALCAPRPLDESEYIGSAHYDSQMRSYHDNPLLPPLADIVNRGAGLATWS